jgi:glycine/D-amino acid oxidase-like deaminating enzyme
MDTQYVQGDCIFARINKTIKQYEYLTEDIETEVIIIGHGSTSITTSLLEYELDSNAMELKSYTSMENIIKSYKLGITALDEIQEFVDKYGNRCDFKRVDSFLYTAKKLEKKEMEEEYGIRKEAGLPVEFIDEANNPFLFGVKGGVLGKGGAATFDPYKYTHHLIEVSCKKGLRTYENTEAIDVKY